MFFTFLPYLKRVINVAIVCVNVTSEIQLLRQGNSLQRFGVAFYAQTEDKGVNFSSLYSLSSSVIR